MGLSLKQAADAVGVSKSQIHRAVRSGRLSASRSEGGTFDIDPSELHRVFGPTRSGDVSPTRGETAIDTADTADTVDRIRLGILESETQALKERLSEMRAERDAWREQASRLALPKPDPAPRRSWWGRKSA